MKKPLVIILFAASIIFAQESKENVVKFFGYVRANYQSDFAKNLSEFLVKQARLGVTGTVNESAGYRVFVDFTRLGKLQTSTTTLDGINVLTKASASFSDVLLDAEAYLSPMKNLKLSLGQFKVPFSTDNLRSGAEIDFINRPMHTNVTPSIRDIGAMITFSHKAYIPTELKAGLFNGSGQNKTENDKTTNYSLRGAFKPVEIINLSVNYYGGKSSGADISIYGFGGDFEYENFLLAGEFVQRKMSANIDVISSAYFAYLKYTFSFKDFFLTHLIPAIRFEHYDPNSDLEKDEILRITSGLSFEFAKIAFARFRVNYELFDHKNGTANPDKLTIELQTRF